MLDHDRGRFGEFQRNPQRRVEIEQVRVRQLLPLMHFPCAAGLRRELNPRRALVRILAISKRTWPAVRRLVGRVDGRRDIAPPATSTCAIVIAIMPSYCPVCMNARFIRSNLNSSDGPSVARQFLEHLRIVLRVDDHEHVAEVFRRRAEQARTTDIDLLDEPSNGVSGFSAALPNGYRLTTTRSIGWIPCARIASRSSGRLRRARIPPNIAGWRVLTRPSIISGKPVTSETFTTGSPAVAIAFAVPPVEINSTPGRPVRGRIPRDLSCQRHSELRAYC